MAYSLCLIPVDDKELLGGPSLLLLAKPLSILLAAQAQGGWFYHGHKLFSCVLPFLLLPLPFSDLC